ncbi:sodium/calcium exchanger regulatory protein 1-like [Leptopilina heterotoma]|uniref:sodium/calcium exchanger regulatory protein 1-like n=1 Tax=Leptopilina heterotoma TaxID=63436 RepID=UPI001CA8A8DC|nr:sodium/calcium exchanger regulatory protein 1-like [Leptopilina heterotoma]
MAPKEGKYQNERNENLDEYFKAVGVPYLLRKMILTSRPTLEVIKQDEDNKWTIKTISLLRTAELSFTLGEEFIENMPTGLTIKNVAKIEDDSIVISSLGPNGEKTERKYEFKEDEVIFSMTHEQSGQVAKRYFKKIP